MAESFEGLSFEDALRRLEDIVRRLETGEPSLEEALALYEEGQRLRAHCETRLQAVEARIRQLELDAAGQPVGERPFPT